jgi:hypothetical protein
MEQSVVCRESLVNDGYREAAYSNADFSSDHQVQASDGSTRRKGRGAMHTFRLPGS